MGYSIKVPGITLQPQVSVNSCWYYSTMMMYAWRIGTGANPPNPSLNPAITGPLGKDQLLAWPQVRLFASMVGMTPKPQMTPTPDQLLEWLGDGPMWTDGISVDWRGGKAGPGHVTVLAGIREAAGGKYEVFVYDPWPVKHGHEGWRPMSHLVSIMEGARDKDRDVTFMAY